MKKTLILVLVVTLFLGLSVPTGAIGGLNYAEIWGSLNEDEKGIFLFGGISGAITDVILLGEFVNEKKDMKLVEFVMDYIIYITKYVSFYGEDMDNFTIIVDSINGFYSDPNNKYCSPSGLAFLGYLQLQGKDISKELVRFKIL